MTDAERFSLVMGLMPMGFDGARDPRVPSDARPSAGYVPGVPRLGIPALRETDGSLGITNPSGFRAGDTATALPAGLALGATFNPKLARETGVILGREARAKGFNVLLGGGMNLARDPRNGRNFEYLSEDPLLSAVLASEQVIGTQAQGVISTIKHFSLNANETNRHRLDAIIDPTAHRESDLLAFQMALERSEPGAVMSAYNKVNGVHASGNDLLLNGVLKGDWGYRGWVMSDWGAVHGWRDALHGLDQESGSQLDERIWFDQPLKEAYAQGQFPKSRLSDMVRRILRSIYAVGLDQPPPQPAIDTAQHHAAALEVARQGIVLLKNEGMLPIAAGKQRIAVIGGQAHLGVLAGGGSSMVTPPGGFAATVPLGGEGNMAAVRNMSFLPSSPLAELRKLLPDASFSYNPGASPAEAAALARRSDLAIVFGVRHESEEFDSPDMSLPFGQDALIEAVAAANPNTLVVLETGNPIAMPWHSKVKAIVEAWFPGQAGGQAIAEILTGKVNPSGRLPMTFPANAAQTPRPELPGFGTPYGAPVTAHYREGAEVGYRWYAKTGAKPLYAFGHGLSYTKFAYRDFTVSGGEAPTASFTVQNVGGRSGADVPQVYLTEAAGEKRARLLGFEHVELRPGEARRITMTIDPRLLSRFDAKAGRWRLSKGTYRLAVGKNAGDLAITADLKLAPRLLGR
ncbi:glycoside hydrolase family 3 protein [bacterium]|nr:glycoside hydrolase family 3 protein [bacterium]